MEKSVCALGFFDGVHEAHSRILTQCVTFAAQQGLKSIAITFEKSPAEYFGRKIKYLTSLEQKEELMKSLGIDEVVVLECSEEMLSMSPEEFINTVLVKNLNASAVFCGFNYTFGKDAAGDASLLKKLCANMGIDVFVMDKLSDFGVTVSSSEIRSALSRGDINLANSLLTRPFEIRGTVMEGKKLGRQLDFPTANLYPDALPDLPYGVYATKCTIDNKEYISVTNVGTNPTVGDKNIRVETYITNFCDDIYQKTIAIKFYKFLRPERKFNNIDALKAQIAKDTEETINYFLH